MNKVVFTQENLNQIIATECGVSLDDWRALVDGRGMRPIKALIKLGADPKIAQAIGDLKLAVTADEINVAYNTNVKSCMTGDEVGEYYQANQIGCIWSAKYRRLIGLTNKIVAPRSYGEYMYVIDKILRKHVKRGSNPFPVRYFTKTTRRVVKLREVIGARISDFTFSIGQVVTEYKSRPVDVNSKEFKCVEKYFIDAFVSDAIFGAIWSDCKSYTAHGYTVHIDFSEQVTEVTGRKAREVLGVKSIKTVGTRDGKTVYKLRFVDKFTEEIPEFEYSTRTYLGRAEIVPNGCKAPYIDFLKYDDAVDVTYEPDVLTETDLLEEHYLARLGNSYKERMNKPRTNYRKKVA